MAMALLEEEVDEGFYDEMLLAAVDAAVSRRFGRPVQQQHHPAPSLPLSAPQKKLMITHVPSSGNHHDRENLKPPPGMLKEVVVAKAPHISSDHRFQSFHREMQRVPAGGGAKGLKPQPLFVKTGGPGNDLKPNEFLKNDGVLRSRDGGRDLKQDGFMKTNGGVTAAWSGRRPFQEVQPWVEERPPSTTVWLQATDELKERNVSWSPGLSGVAVFKECQEAAMQTLVPSDYTMMHGKPFIKKAGWRKIAFFFDISFEIKEKKIQFDPQSNVQRAEFVVRASMPSGRFTDSWGSCDRGEKRYSKPNHDIPSTAETRAKTRACQDLLGIGEYKLDGATH